MSYILDALKKIEHEKNKKAHSGGRVSITGDLFQERSRPSATTFSLWKIVALITAVSLVTCAGSWLVFRGKSKKSAAMVRQSPPVPAAAVNQSPPAPPFPLPVVPTPPPIVMPSSVPPVVPSALKAPDTDEEEDTHEREVRRAKKLGKALLSTQKQPSQAVQAPADIKLSGIAWQDERTERRAVINGFLLKEGAVISGAKIIDIQAGKVRFSSATGQFEIKLDAVLPAEAKR